MTKLRTILISNDDGVQAPGIKCLAKVLSSIAKVIVVAPDRNRSGASNSLTLDNPLRALEIEKDVYSVNGTPTDCVHIAVTGLLDEKPDLVVSGINEGGNLGDDILYSGTIAAATEGRFLGLPAIAVSLEGKDCNHYETAAQIAKELVLKLVNEPLPSDTILNVNVPDLSISELKGMQATRFGTRHIAEPTISQIDPRGRQIYWVGGPGAAADAGPGTDFFAVANGAVSITPVKVDLTHYQAIDQLAKWTEQIEFSVE